MLSALKKTFFKIRFLKRKETTNSKTITIMAVMNTSSKETITTIETIIKETPVMITIFLIGLRKEVEIRSTIRWIEMVTTIIITMEVDMIRMAAVAIGTKTTPTIKAI